MDRYEMPGATAIFTQLRSTPPSEGSAATVASDPITSSQPENTSVRPTAPPTPSDLSSHPGQNRRLGAIPTRGDTPGGWQPSILSSAT